MHEICPTGGLDAALTPVIDSILLNGPVAVRDSKKIALEIAGLTITDQRAADLARQHANTRQSEEAREGFRSYIEKRSAAWKSDEG